MNKDTISRGIFKNNITKLHIVEINIFEWLRLSTRMVFEYS